MSKSAKEMFEELGYSYKIVKNDYSEDTIQCFDLTKTIINKFPEIPNIQFNLISKCIVINDLMFINVNLLRAINKQVEELGW